MAPRPPCSPPVTDLAAPSPDARTQRCRERRCGECHPWRDSGGDASGRRSTVAAPDRRPAAMGRLPRRHRRGRRGLRGGEGVRPFGRRALGGRRGGRVARETARAVAGVACGGQGRGCASVAGYVAAGLAGRARLGLVGMPLFHRESVNRGRATPGARPPAQWSCKARALRSSSASPCRPLGEGWRMEGGGSWRLAQRAARGDGATTRALARQRWNRGSVLSLRDRGPSWLRSPAARRPAGSPRAHDLGWGVPAEGRRAGE